MLNVDPPLSPGQQIRSFASLPDGLVRFAMAPKLADQCPLAKFTLYPNSPMTPEEFNSLLTEGEWANINRACSGNFGLEEVIDVVINGDLWDSLVSAEREISRLRAALNDSDSRIAALTDALSPGASVWDQHAALNFLMVFPQYVPEFIPQLFSYALGERWQGLARSLIAAAPRQEIVPEIVRLTFAELPGSDAEDYLHLAALLARLDAGEELGKVVTDAFDNDSEDIRQAGAFILECYRNVIPPKFWR